MLRRFSMLLLCIASPALLRASWQVADSQEQQPGAPGLRLLVETVRSNGISAEVHAILFDRKKYSVKLVDLAEGAAVSDGLRQSGAVAGTNGGYFHEDRTPLGLVVINGKVVHPLEHAKILTGLLVSNRTGAWLLRTGEMRSAAKYPQVLQAGPFLIDHGKKVPGLNATRSAERTVLFADKEGMAGILITQPLTLAEAAEVLATPGLVPGVKVERALNLDGGSSTALWVSGENGFSHSEWKQVRNAVGVFPRK